MKEQISNYIRAGYPGLYIVSHEEQRVESEIAAVAKSLKEYELYSWSITQGIFHHKKDGEADNIKSTEQPIACLQTFSADNIPEKSIILLRDFHMFLATPFPPLFRAIKDMLLVGKAKQKHIVIVGCKLTLPVELEKEITVLEFKLPDRKQLRAVVDSMLESSNIDISIKDDVMESILDDASGLTTTEAENAIALSIVESKTITPAIIQREKSNTIRKNGLLEIVDSKITLDDIGGLENIKRDLLEKAPLFTSGAREYGLPTPRGYLTVGQPGTGKSLVAQAIAEVFGLPLLRLEAGKLFGSLVGQSEANWRNAFATAKAMAPCVLWIDEVDGLFCGAQSSGQTDSGVTNRVIKAILQDMQYNSEGIFYMFTANDVDNLPDPLIDRLDVWSVDLPNVNEREAIWAIHIAKRNRKLKDYDLKVIARETEGFSGRQIEQIWLKAMTIAFNAHKPTPTMDHVADAIKRFVPTSKTMAEAINRRRERLKDRATPASAPEIVATAKGRKLHLN